MRRWVEAGRGCRRRLSSDEGGFTLVEVMAAITILVVAVLAIAGVAAQSMRSTRLARDRQLATAAATAAVEEARAFSYGDLAVEATCALAVAESDYVSGSCPGTPTLSSTGEELVLTTDPDGIDLEVVEGRFSVRTFVSWYDDATVQGTRDAKRVTVSVTWDEVGGPDRELVQSTIISEADRGLPVPEFVVRPNSQEVTVESGEGNSMCLSQTLTNIGAADTYDFLAAKNSDNGTPAGDHISMGNWLVYGWLGESDKVPTTPLEAFTDTNSDGVINADDTDGNGNPIPDSTYRVADGTADPQDTLMRDRTGDLIPDSDPDIRVPRNASRIFVTCYYQKSNAEADPIFTVTVRSGFDSSVVSELTHTVDTSDLILNLYLRDPESVPNDSGVCTDSDWDRANDFFLLLDGSAPHCTTLRNFDVNHDSLPGLLLPRGTNPPSAKFEYQFTSPTTIGGSGTLRLWTSHPDAVSGTEGSDRTIIFDVVLNRFSATDSSRNATFHTTTVTYTHSPSTTWQAHTLDLSAISDTGFLADEFIRLHLSCPNTSARDCVIAYDTAAGSGPPPADANLVVSSP